LLINNSNIYCDNYKLIRISNFEKGENLGTVVFTGNLGECLELELWKVIIVDKKLRLETWDATSSLFA
jgi:hypothetical protein